MDIILALIPISFILLITATAIFLWAMKSGQYDDLEGPAHRILHDDDDPAHQAAIKPKNDPDE
ncbi:MAG: cbb3-type cytochrome oxidase assembly protein CcoS [Litorivicinus sp.]